MVPGTLGIVVIHGMGAQRPGFSDPLEAEVSSRLGAKASRCAWQEVFWADVLEGRESALLASMHNARDPAGDPVTLRWLELREFVVHSFGDALAYHRDRTPGSVYHAVQRRISEAVASLSRRQPDPAAPLVVLAHSLGAHMMSDYIWDRQNWTGPGPDPCAPMANLVAMITFGCNIPLFALEFDIATPIALPGPGIARPGLRDASEWLNYFDADDVLGWPLRPLYARDAARLTARQARTLDRIQDRPINVGGVVTGWTPLSHAGYWTDNDFTRPVAAYLARLLAAVDA